MTSKSTPKKHMIEQTKSYKTSDGAVHLTLEAAKMQEIKLCFTRLAPWSATDSNAATVDTLAEVLVDNAQEFAEILSERARKPRKPKSTKPVKPTKPSDAPKT
jgi:hypothetical protein